MTSNEERVIKLEQRVTNLENTIINLESKILQFEKAETIKAETIKPELIKAEIEKPELEKTILKHRELPFNQQKEKKQAINQVKEGKVKEGKDKEALVGKYIIGALASVLVFIGAISFIALVWNKMTPETKLLLISLTGSVLSALGFWLIRTKKNPITSIILGTGAGLLFISILSANLVFHMIGNNTSLFLAGLWAVLFIISSWYTNLFFTTIIAYIGSYITLILGLVNMKDDKELLVLILFAGIISSVTIYTSFKKNKVALITSIILSLLSFSSILVLCFGDGKKLLNSYGAQIAVIFIIYLLMNLLYRVIKNTNIIPIYLAVSFITTILTIIFINYLNERYLEFEGITLALIFFIINLVQFTLNNLLYKGIDKWLTRYYAVTLVFASMLINFELYELPTGIILIGLLLILSTKVFRRENHLLLIGVITLFDSLFLISNYSDNLIFFAYGMIQLGLMGYVLWECTLYKGHRLLNALKTIGILVIIMNSFGMSSNFINFLGIASLNEYLNNAVGYLFSVIAIIILYKIGYFKNWKNEQFKFFSTNDTLENDKYMKVLLYICTTGIYFYGLKEIITADKWFLQLIVMLAAIANALMQSKIILSGNARNKPFTGIWIVIKYLILTWTIFGSYLDLNITSVVYSIVGLIVAIGSISAGFKLKIKSIRLYGLVLTIIMVAKFIVVDLNQENSITRVLALIAGGGLCFLISFIYNKLSENYS